MIEPSNLASGGTMTTFDGAALRPGSLPLPFPFPLLDPPLPMPTGRLPVNRLTVRTPTRTRPTIDRTGASHEPTGPRPYGSPARRGRAPALFVTCSAPP